MMYQADLFSSMARKHGRFIDAGMYASVYEMTDGNVCKIARNDGTRNWLELCALHTAKGTLKSYMPEVFSVVSLEDDKYMAFMPFYEPIGYSCDLYDIRAHVSYVAARDEFADYLEILSGRRPDDWEVFNDIHGGNIMVCPKRGFVITDPSALYYVNGCNTCSCPLLLN